MMKRVIVYSLLSAAIAIGAAAAGDIFQQVRVSKADAAKEVVTAIASNSVAYYRVRDAFKAASPAARAAMTEQILVWTKAYVSSPQFAKDYAAYRAAAKPEPPEQRVSVDEELKQRRAERLADLEKSKKSIAEMPAEYRKMAEDGYKAAVEGMKQLDTPEFRKLERDALVAERQAAQQEHERRLQKWQAEYPADPKVLLRARLEEFLRTTAGVDFDAKLVSRHGRMRFVSGELEAKPENWKLAYRAGREATAKARQFAQTWLREL